MSGFEGAQNSKTEAARDEAGGVARDASQAGQHVAGVAKDEAGKVAGDAKREAKDFMRDAQSELKRQAAEQQSRVAQGLHSLGEELSGMASSSEQSGMASHVVRGAAERTESVASWLDQRDPGSLVSEVKRFAARRPGAFIAIAAGAGILAGRAAHALMDNAKDDATDSAIGSDGGTPGTEPQTTTAGTRRAAGATTVAGGPDPLAGGATDPSFATPPPVVPPAPGPGYGTDPGVRP